MSAEWFVREATPHGPAGVAVVCVHGPGAAEALARVGVEPRPPGALFLAHLESAEGALDEALVWVRAADEVELHVHGSVPLVRELCSVLGGFDASPKDLLQLAMEALVDAPSEVGARLLLAQAEGALQRELERWATAPRTDACRGLEKLLATSRACAPWWTPRRVVLEGPVNAGKSTLFNALLGYERVITSFEEGTTRDAVAERIHLGGVPFDLFDTAGLRPVQEASLEGRGQALGQRIAESADFRVFLVPPGYSGQVPESALVLRTQGDRVGADPHAIAALPDPIGAVRALEGLLLPRLGLPDPIPFGAPLLWSTPQCQALEAALFDSDPKRLPALLRNWLS